jgi:hypothetical protein
MGKVPTSDVPQAAPTSVQDSNEMAADFLPVHVFTDRLLEVKYRRLVIGSKGTY